MNIIDLDEELRKLPPSRVRELEYPRGHPLRGRAKMGLERIFEHPFYYPDRAGMSQDKRHHRQRIESESPYTQTS